MELLRIGIFAAQAGILKKILMGMDGKEEEEVFFFWIHHQLAVLSVPAGYTDSKRHTPVDLLIWIDVTVTHRTIIWPLLASRERGSLVPFISKCALMKVILFSAA